MITMGDNSSFYNWLTVFHLTDAHRYLIIIIIIIIIMQRLTCHVSVIRQTNRRRMISNGSFKRSFNFIHYANDNKTARCKTVTPTLD